MRNISAAGMAALVQERGGEPLIFIRVDWTPGLSGYYADKTISEWGIIGKILNLSELENVVNLSGSSNSQSISVTLDDVDGTLKNIFDYNDIHKRPVHVYQWFTGLHLSDAFVIFEGVISSPITWKEGDRTLSFDIISQLEDKEVGFSVEEGSFTNVPSELVGKAWPLPFGYCLKIPIIKLDPIPSGATTESTLIPDPSLPAQMSKLINLINEYAAMATLAFNTALLYYYRAGRGGGGAIDEQLDSLGDQYQDQGNQFLHEMWKAQQDASNLGQQLARQKSGQKKSISTTSDCFPKDGNFNVSFGGAAHEGTFADGKFHVKDQAHPGIVEGQQTNNLGQVSYENSMLTSGQETIRKLDFFWIKPGQQIFIESDLPTRYIVAMLPCTITAVWSKKTYNGAKIDTVVPSNYYSVAYMPVGAVIATVLTVTKPLSHYKDEGWDDEITIDLVSPVGPNTVDIITWLITTYTTLGIDGASFAHVRAALIPFPSNFCLFERKNIVALLSEIAYLARCAIWLKQGIFYLRYLVEEPTPVDTITIEDDIIGGSAEVGHTDTESLITKLTASFVTNYGQDKPTKIIIRNNVAKYGIQEQHTDWFIYNSPGMVTQAATFWSIRKSNTWKLLKIKTPIHKLRLETFDAVTLNLSKPYVANGSVTALINSVQFDSAALEIIMELWVPVRIGEMSKYYFFWPPDSTVVVYPIEQDFTGPGSETEGDLAPIHKVCDTGPITIKHDKTKHGSVHPGSNNDQPGAEGAAAAYASGSDKFKFPDDKNQARDYDGIAISIAEADRIGSGRVQRDRPRSDYSYRNYRRDIAAPKLKPGAYPGQIIDLKEGLIYNIKLYYKGTDGKPATTTAVALQEPSTPPQKNEWIVVLVLLKDKSETEFDNVFIPTKAGSSVFAGQVVSGSGSTYSMRIYKKGLSGESTVVAGCKQLHIHSMESIPAGAWTLVAETTKIDGSGNAVLEYVMQFPVWME